MNVSLTPELEALIEKKVKSGMYHTASEVVREGLRLLEDQDLSREARRNALVSKIKEGIQSADEGRTTSFSAEELTELATTVEREGLARLEQKRNARLGHA